MDHRQQNQNGVKDRWKKFVDAPENEELLRPYERFKSDIPALFKAIGEDLANSKKDKRDQAFWPMVKAVPEFFDILHEQETRQQGFRGGAGKDHQLVNRSMDVITYLYRDVVENQRFNLGETRNGDPRPYFMTTLHNWKVSGNRRRTQEVSLEEMIASAEEDGFSPSFLEDRSVSVEDEVLETLTMNEGRQEILSWGMFDSHELAVAESVYIDERSYVEIARELGKSEVAVRKMMSRARIRAVTTRDEVFTSLLFSTSFLKTGRFTAAGILSGLMVRVRLSVEPLGWFGSPSLMICPLSRGFPGAPGHIYLVGAKTYDETQVRPTDPGSWCTIWGVYSYGRHLISPPPPIRITEDIFFPPPSLQAWNGPSAISVLHKFPTEVPGLNTAAADWDGYDEYWLMVDGIGVGRCESVAEAWPTKFGHISHRRTLAILAQLAPRIARLLTSVRTSMDPTDICGHKSCGLRNDSTTRRDSFRDLPPEDVTKLNGNV